DRHQARLADCSLCPIQLDRRSHEHAHLVRLHAIRNAFRQPFGNQGGLEFSVFDDFDGRIWAVEYRRRSTSVDDYAVDIGKGWAKQLIGTRSYLMGCPVVDA